MAVLSPAPPPPEGLEKQKQKKPQQNKNLRICKFEQKPEKRILK